MAYKKIKKIYYDRVFRSYFSNLILGSLPSISFFFIFPYLSHFLSEKYLNILLQVLPFYTIIYAVDFGASRIIIRVSTLKNSKLYFEKIMNSYLSNIIFYAYLISFLVFILFEFFGVNFFSSVEFHLAKILIFFSTPLILASNVYYTYFDTFKSAKFNNYVSSPLIALTWIFILFISILKLESALLIVSAFIFPRLILLYLQLIYFPYSLKLRILKPQLIFKNKKTITQPLLSSILAPICSNLDRIVFTFLNYNNVGWIIVYNGLSEISRKTGGLIRPITRIYYRMKHFTEAEKGKLTLINSFVSFLNILLTIFFSIIFLVNGKFFSDNSLFHFSILCSICFIASSSLQVNSSIFFLLALIKGKIMQIIKYQSIQVVIMIIFYVVSFKYLTVYFMPIAYIFVKISDYLFLRKITNV